MVWTLPARPPERAECASLHCQGTYPMAKVVRSLIAPVRTRWRLWRNRRKQHRCLDIGPGPRLEGFETLDIRPRRRVDYVWDASKPLPFPDDTFDIVHASHVLEHIPWYKTEDVLAEWRRIIKPGGVLELWVPDALKIFSVVLEFERNGKNSTALEDGWYPFNEEKDPLKWACGRLFGLGDLKGSPGSPNWHRAAFTPSYLRRLLKRAGFAQVTEMSPEEVRSVDHGWINLGMKGRK